MFMYINLVNFDDFDTMIWPKISNLANNFFTSFYTIKSKIVIYTNPQAKVHNFTVRCRCFNVDKNNASYCLTQRPLFDSD